MSQLLVALGDPDDAERFMAAGNGMARDRVEARVNVLGEIIRKLPQRIPPG